MQMHRKCSGVKKKILCLLLATVMCFSICACGASVEINGGEKILSKEEFESCSEYIELTTENWSDYLEIVEEEIIETDAFGEETGRYTSTFLTLKENCYISEDNAIRLTYTRDYYNRTEEVTEDFVFAQSVSRYCHISPAKDSDIICEKVKGTILKLTVPAEKWNTDEEGDKFLSFQVSKGNYQRIYDYDVVFDYFIH